MKKKTMVTIAVGAAVTGLAIYLFATDSGKKIRKKIVRKGLDTSEKIEDLFKAGKERFETIKTDMLKECDREDVVA
jgi:gas vesicle protein